MYYIKPYASYVLYTNVYQDDDLVRSKHVAALKYIHTQQCRLVFKQLLIRNTMGVPTLKLVFYVNYNVACISHMDIPLMPNSIQDIQFHVGLYICPKSRNITLRKIWYVLMRLMNVRLCWRFSQRCHLTPCSLVDSKRFEETYCLHGKGAICICKKNAILSLHLLS